MDANEEEIRVYWCSFVVGFLNCHHGYKTKNLKFTDGYGINSARMDEVTIQQQQKLEELRIEHRDLDAVINQIASAQPVDLFQLQRLKKRKLALKDIILKLESDLLPDIIA